MIHIKTEKIMGIKEEVSPLFEIHWSEVKPSTDKLPLNFDWEQHRIFEDLGLLNFVTVREGDKLIGYCLDIINTHPLHEGCLYATNMMFFIHPDHRNGTNGLDMFKFVELCLLEKGAVVWAVSVKAGAPTSALLKRRGFSKDEDNYLKWL